MPAHPPKNHAARAIAALKKQVVLLKAISFALVGVINVVVNYSIFWLGLTAIGAVPALSAALAHLASACGCVSVERAGVIAANIVAWVVAVSGSYVMNSLITFAAESGRKLRWRAYFAFAASGLLGLLTDTTALLIAMSFLPILLAKLVAIGAGFVVNFSMSHFVVFRAKPAAAKPAAARTGTHRH
jgi:putative flippase GtrA